MKRLPLSKLKLRKVILHRRLHANGSSGVETCRSLEFDGCRAARIWRRATGIQGSEKYLAFDIGYLGYFEGSLTSIYIYGVASFRLK